MPEVCVFVYVQRRDEAERVKTFTRARFNETAKSERPLPAGCMVENSFSACVFIFHPGTFQIAFG